MGAAVLRQLVFAGVILGSAIPAAAEPSPPPGLWVRRGCLDGAQLICHYQWLNGDRSGYPLMYKQVLRKQNGRGETFEFLYRCTPKPQVVRITRAASLASMQRWTNPGALKAECRS